MFAIPTRPRAYDLFIRILFVDVVVHVRKSGSLKHGKSFRLEPLGSRASSDNGITGELFQPPILI